MSQYVMLRTAVNADGKIVVYIQGFYFFYTKNYCTVFKYVMIIASVNKGGKILICPTMFKNWIFALHVKKF